MWIKQIDVHNYRAFQKDFTMNLSQNITVIAGLNGVGKSTLLAILTNVGEVKNYKLLNGKLFRGEFSDVIMYDKGHDTIGDKAKIYFAGLPEDPGSYNVTNPLLFRASVHQRSIKTTKYVKDRASDNYIKKEKKTTISRYRLIPKKSKNRTNERKVVWSSYYIGLSRLDPIGEKDSAVSKGIPDELAQKIIKDHVAILSEKDNLRKASIANFDIGTKFPKANITSDNYGFASNSNGQDNTGQILEAVYSFENLKKEMTQDGQEYIGGILAIDELDAALHPAAQKKLFDWLLKKSKELKLQIVFTTHSITLLEHASRMQRIKENLNSIKINYLHAFGDNPDKVTVKENPEPNYYKYDLQQTYTNTLKQPTDVFVLSEDEVTRWFAKKIISVGQFSNNLLKLKWLDVNISWSHLLNLYSSGPDNFKDYFFILDPDLNLDNKDSQLNDYMNEHYVTFQINSSGSNVFILPGTSAIEQMMWDYVHGIDSANPIFDDPSLIKNGINYDSLRLIDKDYPDDIKHKKWFKDNKLIMDVMIKYWIRDNADEVKKLVGIMASAYKRITSR